jgi:hypothetical protein
MNRAARRTLINKPQEFNTFVGTHTGAAKKEAIRYSVRGLSAAIAVVLHDKYDWDATQISEMLVQASNQFECILAGEVTLDDLLKLSADLGVVIH